MKGKSDDQLSDKEISERMAKALRRSLVTPPKHHKPATPKKPRRRSSSSK